MLRSFSIPLRFCLILSWFFWGLACHAQVTDHEAYNRFQYHRYKWRTYHHDAMHLYYPHGYDSLGKYMIERLPGIMERVKHRMVTRLVEVPNIIIYPSVDQLYESNIGMYEVKDMPLPTFVATGNRMVVFFNGSHEDLEQQLYESLVRSVWEAQLDKALEQQLKSGTDPIPFWVKEGAIRYFAHQWPLSAEDELKRLFTVHEFHNWQEVIALHPRLAGQAFCYFLSDRFYEQAVAQLYGQLKVKKELRRAIRLITKRELDSLYIMCLDYYLSRFNEGNDKTLFSSSPAMTIERKRGLVKQVLPVDDFRHVVYEVYRNNKRKVFSYDTLSQKLVLLAKYPLPPWLNDYSRDDYPMISETENSVSITMPRKGKVHTYRYNLSGGRLNDDVIIGIDGVKQVLPTGDRGQYLLSGYRNGQSDIVHYDAHRERYTPLTNDPWDDGGFSERSGRVVFNSMRPHNISDTGKVVWAQGIYEVMGKEVQSIVTDTTGYIRWGKPELFDGGRILTTHTGTGTERFVVLKNNVVDTGVQVYPFHYAQDGNRLAIYSAHNDSIRISSLPLDSTENREHTIESPWLRDYRKRAAQRAREDSIIRQSQQEQYTFLRDILMPKGDEQAANQDSGHVLTYRSKLVKPYILQLHSAYFSAQANNDYFINRYQPFLNYQGQFKFPEIGAMLQAGFTDLFENHHVGIGFRIPTGTEGSDFFVTYKNTKKNLDWGLTYFRKVETIQPDAQRMWVNEDGLAYPNLAKVKTHYYALSLERPLTYYLSVGLEQAVRSDRTVFLSTEQYSLKFEDIKSLWSITTLSLKQYKLKPTLPMLHKGYTAKLMLDAFKAFSQQGDGLYALSVQAQLHQPIYRHITLEAKLQAGQSGGAAYMLYNLAGVDNNMTVKTDSTVHFDQSAPYAFQTLVTPFRGYRQNTLYGNRFALLNADVWFPLFQSLIPIETPLSFVNLLQLGMFTDIGAASESWQTPVASTGLKWSYGLSARSKLAGYSIGMHVAWPGSFNTKPLWYFSLGS